MYLVNLTTKKTLRPGGSLCGDAVYWTIVRFASGAPAQSGEDPDGRLYTKGGIERKNSLDKNTIFAISE